MNKSVVLPVYINRMYSLWPNKWFKINKIGVLPVYDMATVISFHKAVMTSRSRWLAVTGIINSRALSN